MVTVAQVARLPRHRAELVVAAGAAREVGHVTVLPDGQPAPDRAPGVLLVVGPGRAHPESLPSTLAAAGAAGLVLAGARPDAPAPRRVVEAARAYGLPLLTSARSAREWAEPAPGGNTAAPADRESPGAGKGVLAELLEQLPSPGHDVRPAVPRLTAFLAERLGVQVAVGTQDGVLAAAPATARAALAPLLPRRGTRPRHGRGEAGQRVPDQRRTVEGRSSRTIPLAGDAVLVVGPRASAAPSEPVPAPGVEPGPDDLADYTARALSLALSGLREQRARQGVDEALREVRLSAFQLLMTGNTVPAQRVMAGVAHRMLDSDRARVFILDCARAARETVLAEAELAVGDRALVVRCPAFDRHVIVLAPVREGADPEGGLRGLLDTFAPQRVLLGGSLDHPLEAVADAYGEALDALTRSPHSPDRAVVAVRGTGVLDVLPPEPARAWASALLRPVLLLPRGGGPALETAAAALEFEAAAAAEVTGVHRNTVTRRTRQVFDAVGLDQERMLDRVVLSLAVQVLARHGAAPAAGGDPGLHALLTGPEVRSWGERTLRPLAEDRRDLLRTVRAWVGCGCRVGPAAEATGLAAKTVRAHIRAAELLLDRDLLPGLPAGPQPTTGYRLASIRPLAVALYATAPDGTPRPPLPLEPRSGEPAPAGEGSGRPRRSGAGG